jgi:hypothetical protein
MRRWWRRLGLVEDLRSRNRKARSKEPKLSPGVLEQLSVAKSQIPSTKSQGVGCQVSGKKNTET